MEVRREDQIRAYYSAGNTVYVVRRRKSYKRCRTSMGAVSFLLYQMLGNAMHSMNAMNSMNAMLSLNIFLHNTYSGRFLSPHR